jgi:hypothetical protein
VVLGAEKKHHLLARPAKRAQEFVYRVGDVFEGGVRPHAAPVEKVARDDGDVHRLAQCGLALCCVCDRDHALEGVLPTRVLSVAYGPFRSPR